MKKNKTYTVTQLNKMMMRDLLQDMRCWMACERIREEKSSGNGKRVLQKTYYSRGRRRNGDKGFFLVKRRIWVCKNRRWIAERDRK